jgi:hypothetical protein
MSRQKPHQQPHAGPGVAEVQDLLRLSKAADAHTPSPPGSRRLAAQLDTHPPQRSGGREHVLAFEQAVDPALAYSHGGQHQGTVRDRLVAGQRRRTG